MPRPAHRRARPRLDAERRNQLLVVVLAVGVVALALGIALFGYYQTKIAPKGEAVLRVEDRSFSLGYFERRARYEIRNGNSTLLRDATQAADALVSMVQRQELVRLGAPEQGIALTEKDIDDEIRKRLNVASDADQSTFAVTYREAVRASGLSTRDYRDIIAFSLLENRLREKFQAEVPAKVEQARYRAIQVATAEEGQSVLDRLDAGEDFAALAKELSVDTSSKEAGGEKPWAARGTLVEPLEQALFSLEPGQRSGLIETQASFVIVEVLERQADRETTAEQRDGLAILALEDWLEARKESAEIVIFLDQDQIAAILEVMVDEVGRGA